MAEPRSNAVIKKLISTVLFFVLLSACAAGKTIGGHTTTPTPSTDIYSPVEPVEIAPLLAVADVSIETTTGPAPTLILSQQTFIAPSDGLFFTVPVASFILAENEALQDRANASLLSQREMDMVRLRLNDDTWRTRINSERDRFRIIHESDQNEITRLLGLVESSMTGSSNFSWESVASVGLAMLLGVITGIVIEYVTLH